MKNLLWVLLLCSSASADTYKLGTGIVINGEHRCVTPKSKARLVDFVAKDPRVTIGHGQMTVTTDKPRGADGFVVDSHGVVHTGFWHSGALEDGARIVVEIVIDTFGHNVHATGAEHQPEATIRIAQVYDGATCIEEWHGNADLVR